MGLKILCEGKEQSDCENWAVAPIFDASEPDIDGIVYTIPNHSPVDVPLVRSLLARDVPVLILKMRTENPADVDAIARAMRPGARLFVGDQYHLEPGALAVREALRRGMCGDVRHVSWRASLPMDQRAAWMDNYTHVTLMDLCYHYFMTLRGYIAPFSGVVFAHSYAPPWMTDRGYVSLVARMPRVTLDMVVNWGEANASSNFFGECSVEGDLGRLWTDGGAASFTGRDLQTVALPTPARRAGCWASIVDGFTDYLGGGAGDGLITFDEYKGVFRLMHAAMMSSARNQSVEF